MYSILIFNPAVDDGKFVGILRWPGDIMKEHGGDFLLMHVRPHYLGTELCADIMLKHEDLHRLLYELATSLGVRVDFNRAVVAIEPGDDTSPSPKVTLSTGEVLTPDLLIGADGPRSVVRQAVLGRPDNAEPSELTVYTATIPGDKLKEDPELRQWLEAEEWPIWMGTHRSVCGWCILRENNAVTNVIVM